MIEDNRNYISGHYLALFAINSGELYEAHKRMARDPSPIWHIHVGATVLPLYCKQVERAFCLITERIACANELKEYYANHLRETEQLNAGELSNISREAQEGGLP